MKKILITLLILTLGTLSAYSTTLPVKLTSYIRNQVPNVEIRFDGLVMYPDKTTYLPLIPAIENPVQDVEIVYSYPAKSNLKNKGEILVFNNNYVLLKVIQTKNGSTISKDTNYPITVKAGMLPQDLLVPSGFYIPESLEGILGDLKIPVGTQNDTIVNKNDDTTHDESTDFLDRKNPITIPKIAALKNKLYFISNYDSNFIRVINSDNTQPLYSLKLDSIPKSIIPARNNKYLMITTGGKTYVDVIDVQREEIAKQIDIWTEPSEVVVDDKNSMAYVGAKDEEAIFTIDTKTMELQKKIIVTGCPINMSVSEDGRNLVYQDKNSGQLYVAYTQDKFKIKPLALISNISKVIATNDAVYVISRTKNQLEVIAYPPRESEGDIFVSAVSFKTVFDVQKKYLPRPVYNMIMAQKPITEKPVDMLYYKDKLFILGAKKNQLDIYDTKTNEIIKTIDLPIGGFSKKLTQVDKTNYVIISNAREEKYLIFDLDTLSTVQQVPLNTRINNLVIMEKVTSGKESL